MMFFRLLPLILFGSLMLHAAETKTTPVAEESLKECDGKLIIGETEWVYLPSVKVKMKARIDTGATTTSIDARNIRIQTRDGKKWALFTLVDRKSGKEFDMEKPVVKVVEIKRHGAEHQKRYAVKMRIVIGHISQYILVTLNDRERFDFPVLIGRNFLRGAAVVDVDRAYSVEPVIEESEAK